MSGPMYSANVAVGLAASAHSNEQGHGRVNTANVVMGLAARAQDNEQRHADL